MKHLLLAAIRSYQRYISPYKGFSCALRVHRGGQGCSAYGYRVIERFGVRRGYALLRRRLAACSEVHRAAHKPLNYQAGYCDCDVPSLDLGGVCDCLGSAANCDCGSCGRERAKDMPVSEQVRAKYKSNRRAERT
jgi:uncharacterized protein